MRNTSYSLQMSLAIPRLYLSEAGKLLFADCIMACRRRHKSINASDFISAVVNYTVLYFA